MVLRVPFAVILADCAGLLAVHDADGTVAEGCAFPVAPAGEWRRPGPEGLQRGGQPSAGGNDGTLRPGDAPEPRALPRVLAGTRPRRLLATRPPSRSARWFGNIAPVRVGRRRRHPPASRPPDKPTPPTMRSASLGTGTDRFRRPGGRWRPKRQSVGWRPVLLLTGIRYETARGPPHGSGRASSGRRSIFATSLGTCPHRGNDFLYTPFWQGCSTRARPHFRSTLHSTLHSSLCSTLRFAGSLYGGASVRGEVEHGADVDGEHRAAQLEVAEAVGQRQR